MHDAHAQMADELARMKSRNDEPAGNTYVANERARAARGLAEHAVTACLFIAGVAFIEVLVIARLAMR